MSTALTTRALFLYPDDYDATTATRRVLDSSAALFPVLKFLYWARTGKPKETRDDFYSGIEKEVFLRKAPPRSLKVLWITILYQFWLLKRIIRFKPQIICAFYFYTALPALVYKYLFNRNCKVVYDPRDYFAYCYVIHPAISWILKLIDNLFIKFADRVIFPDRQYFSYYGMFKLSPEKYFILPNSTEDVFESVSNDDIYETLAIPRNALIIPLIGYFSETRGKELFYKAIQLKMEGVHFVVAGSMRDKSDQEFFSSQPNVTFLDKIPYQKALWIMKNATFVPLLYDAKSLNNKYAIPTKFYDSLMVGTPVMVSEEQTDVRNLVEKFSLGVYIPYNNLQAFIEKLIIFRQSESGFNKDALRAHFKANYDFSLFKGGLKDFYGTLINKIDK